VAGDAEAAAEDEPSTRGCLEIAALLSKPGAGSEAIAAFSKARWAPWGVQVAGNFSLDRAMASYAALQEKHAAIVGDQAPMVLRTVARSRGTAPIFQVRLPANDRESANALCSRLRAAGGACVVFRN
jgi:hypothetical protein